MALSDGAFTALTASAAAAAVAAASATSAAAPSSSRPPATVLPSGRAVSGRAVGPPCLGGGKTVAYAEAAPESAQTTPTPAAARGVWSAADGFAGGGSHRRRRECSL